MAAIDAKKAPPVPVSKIRVEAVHSGYFGEMEMEFDKDTGKGDVFDIPIFPLNPKTGLPQCYSDHRRKVMSGRSGWMKPYGPSEEKKIADLEAAFKSTGTVASAPVPVSEAQVADLAAENAAMKKRIAELEAGQGKKGQEFKPTAETVAAQSVPLPVAETPAPPVPPAPAKPSRPARTAAAKA